jgi:hypothetical protein
MHSKTSTSLTTSSAIRGQVLSWMLVLGAGALVSIWPVGAGQVPAEKLSLQERPLWTVTGTWSPDGGELLLVDSLRDEVLRYNAQGEFVGFLPWPKAARDDYRPSFIHAHGDSYLFEYATNRIAELDSRFRKVRDLDLLPRAKSAGTEVLALFQWVPLDDALLAVADLRRPDGSMVSGVVRIPLADPGALQVLETVEDKDPRRQMFHLGLPTVAAAGDRGYFLLLQSRPLLTAFSSSQRSARSVPGAEAILEGFAGLPQLPADRRVGNTSGLFSALEAARFASGLYATDDALFVALRQPGTAPGTTSWRLRRVEPASGRFADLELPTTAPHLSIIPGPRHWALVEKGPVLGPGHQVVLGLTLIPTEALTGNGG